MKIDNKILINFGLRVKETQKIRSFTRRVSTQIKST